MQVESDFTERLAKSERARCDALQRLAALNADALQIRNELSLIHSQRDNARHAAVQSDESEARDDACQAVAELADQSTQAEMPDLTDTLVVELKPTYETGHVAVQTEPTARDDRLCQTELSGRDDSGTQTDTLVEAGEEIVAAEAHVLDTKKQAPLINFDDIELAESFVSCKFRRVIVWVLSKKNEIASEEV